MCSIVSYVVEKYSIWYWLRQVREERAYFSDRLPGQWPRRSEVLELRHDDVVGYRRVRQ